METEPNKTPQAKESLNPVSKWLGMRRFSAVELFDRSRVCFFVSFPFVEEVKGGDIIVSILLSLVLILRRPGGCQTSTRITLVVAVLLATPAIAGRWINHFRPDLVPLAVFLCGGTRPGLLLS